MPAVALDSGMMTTRLTMLMMKNGSQQSTNTTTITTTIRVTLRSERRRLVKPARAPEDFTYRKTVDDDSVQDEYDRDEEGGGCLR